MVVKGFDAGLGGCAALGLTKSDLEDVTRCNELST